MARDGRAHSLAHGDGVYYAKHGLRTCHRTGVMIARSASPKTCESGRRAGLAVWLTGLSAAGKTTISLILESELGLRGLIVERLDGDVVRQHLSAGLGYSKDDRDTNVERIGWVASTLARAGAAVVVTHVYMRQRRDFP